uniref:Lysophosphatidic acid phosphatase type 6 n=1 Tax=Talaromyces marneffei PM1 TaxID=1077442 RepID=A0A093UPZ5_TALMA
MAPHVCLLLGAILLTTTLAVDNSWHPPDPSAINNLDLNLGSDGVFDFIFDTSLTPDERYGQYNYCNMPHVRRREYVVAPAEYELVYVEILYHYGQPSAGSQMSANTYWQLEEHSPFDLFPVSAFPGTCVFPQITRTGLQDSWQHGHDIYEVYHDLLRFLPDELDQKRMEFRVTNNVITSQVAGMVIGGMYGEGVDVPLHVQRAGIDSLEPQYPCPGGQMLFTGIKDSDSASSELWKSHLEKTKDLLNSLDAISGVPSDADDWHTSYDHYFDNLSSRLCHSKPLPCKRQRPQSNDECITRSQANSVLRLGQWEYSRLFRDAPSSLIASTALYGVFIAELAQHLREQIKLFDQTDRVLYRHNVAHDGSISWILSLLQIKQMVWPGMGAEIVFELYRRKTTSSEKEEGSFFINVMA